LGLFPSFPSHLYFLSVLGSLPHLCLCHSLLWHLCHCLVPSPLQPLLLMALKAREVADPWPAGK
jgi:hypothetical protein